jgi:hypothetical protein
LGIDLPDVFCDDLLPVSRIHANEDVPIIEDHQMVLIVTIINSP